MPAIWPTDEQIQAWREDGLSIPAIAREIGCGKTTVRRHLNGERRQIAGQPVGSPGVNRKSNEWAEKVAQSEEAKLITEAGLDPQQWEIGTVGTLASGDLRPSFRPVRVAEVKSAPQLEVVRNGSPIVVCHEPRTVERTDGAKTVVITSDHHGTNVDWRLHRLSLQVIRDAQPDILIANGDLIDCERISKYPQRNPQWKVELNDDLAAGHRILTEQAAAAPADCERLWTLGNHEVRLQDRVLSSLPEAFELRQVGGQRPVLSFEHLMRLDEIGWRITESPDGTYPHPRIHLVEGPGGLSVFHGSKAAQGAGQTVHKNQLRKANGTITGHTHRLGLVVSVLHVPGGRPILRLGAELGMMCGYRHGYNEVDDSDWVPGFGTVTIWPDGTYHIDPAIYRDGVLTWRGRRYEDADALDVATDAAERCGLKVAA